MKNKTTLTRHDILPHSNLDSLSFLQIGKLLSIPKSSARAYWLAYCKSDGNIDPDDKSMANLRPFLAFVSYQNSQKIIEYMDVMERCDKLAESPCYDDEFQVTPDGVVHFEVK